MIARTAPTLAMEGVNHVYPGGVRALRDVTLEIPGGQRVAIIGQNGSGKSTLVRHLNGLLRPTSAQLARSVGLVFQDPDRQIFSGSVRNEVEFGPRNVGMRRDELRATVLEAIAAVGLEDEEGTNPYDLGGSRRKLLALASVLAMRTPVLVLDEPTTGQDLHGVRIVRRVVADANAEGRTVIAISHDMEFVAETFDRVVVLREGEVIMDGSPRTVFGEASWGTLRSTFLEPPLAAVAGARLGLGPTPSVESLLEALAAQ
jgi:energy-coupling factor transport system ATP-binding protein